MFPGRPRGGSNDWKQLWPCRARTWLRQRLSWRIVRLTGSVPAIMLRTEMGCAGGGNQSAGGGGSNGSPMP
jgi:hypothetical protein